MRREIEMNDQVLEQVAGAGIGADPHFCGSVGNIIAYYLNATSTDMPTNKQLNIASIYQHRLNAIAGGDTNSINTDNAKLAFLGVDVNVLDGYAREVGLYPAAA